MNFVNGSGIASASVAALSDELCGEAELLGPALSICAIGGTVSVRSAAATGTRDWAGDSRRAAPGPLHSRVLQRHCRHRLLKHVLSLAATALAMHPVGEGDATGEERGQHHRGTAEVSQLAPRRAAAGFLVVRQRIVVLVPVLLRFRTWRCHDVVAVGRQVRTDADVRR